MRSSVLFNWRAWHSAVTPCPLDVTVPLDISEKSAGIPVQTNQHSSDKKAGLDQCEDDRGRLDFLSFLSISWVSSSAEVVGMATPWSRILLSTKRIFVSIETE
jgi:hypothetical protein